MSELSGNEYYYTASTGLVHLIYSLTDGAALGSGIINLVGFAHNLIGPEVPPVIVTNAISILNNLFGSYPTRVDFIPSIVLSALFGLIMFAHIIVLVINESRGHHFYISYIWIVYSAMKVVGFALRARWSQDIIKVNLGLAGEVFLIVPTIIIVSANLILAQRLFTWRHPVGGSRKLFWGFVIVTYLFVLILIAITILASFVPYLNYISLRSYKSWIATVQFTSILVIVYSLTAVALIGLSFWLPTKKDELRYTYQPWWIESFAPFYFPEKGAAQRAAAGFMKRNSNHRHATRVIAATHHHFHSVKGLTNQRGDLKHNVSMGLLIITTTLILIGAIGRAIVVFQAREDRYKSPAASIWFMYVCWGIFEVIINVLYIVGRVDLRFYRPDRLPQEVRSIVTTDQSYYPSSDEEEDGFHRDKPETFAKLQDKSAPGCKQPRVVNKNSSNAYGGPQTESDDVYTYDPKYQDSTLDDDDSGNFYDDDEDVDDIDDWDFTVPKTAKVIISSSDEDHSKVNDYNKDKSSKRSGSSPDDSEFNF
ncbi:uncharacterized protein LODBEIA_P33840 [Lodderomyces beijingensis]|uniref:Uncharacterized protein n=1 Tax=Lodderomyces beijingensis TaxID=1775926 RepID=A0ABP0ZLY7_9ASCO